MEEPSTDFKFKAGFISVVGRPNVGKSTLINRLLGQKVAAVSPKPQTTRRQQLGILTLESSQLIFVDTPGIHLPKHKLGQHMNEEAVQSLEESDLILWLVDAEVDPTEEDLQVAAHIREDRGGQKVILALNKIDKIGESEIPGREAGYLDLLPEATLITISATRGDHLDRLVSLISAALPETPPFYPEDQLTDAYERDIAADLIREAALRQLYDEVPHSLAIRIDEFKERGDRGAYIAATIFVERESQKAIVIGQGGKMLRTIGTTARKEIEAMSGRKVYLELKVKTRKNWRNDLASLRAFGFRT